MSDPLRDIGEYECVDPSLGDQMWRYALPDTEPDLRRQLDNHLDICHACRIDRAFEKHVAYALKGTSPEIEREAPGGLIRRVSRSWVIWSLASAAVILVLAVLVIPSWWRGRSDVPQGTRAVVLQAMARASQNGMLLPGSESLPVEDAPAYRAGLPADAPVVLEKLNEIELISGQHPDAAEPKLYLAGGRLAAGQMASASAVVHDGVRRFPDDPRFQILAAVIAYRESRLDEAERILRSVLEDHSGEDVARFNLACVLAEIGRTEEAREVLQPIVRSERHEVSNTVLIQRSVALHDALNHAP